MAHRRRIEVDLGKITIKYIIKGVDNMPYKSEKIKLKGLQDRRKRLTDEQRKEIEELYGSGLYSLNDLAKKFNVRM